MSFIERISDDEWDIEDPISVNTPSELSDFVIRDTNLTSVKAAGLAVVANDTGRVLMLQRALSEDGSDSNGGKWEFPGGTLDEGEEPYTAALREWREETGLKIPDGHLVHEWISSDGIYQLFVYRISNEDYLQINLDHEDRSVLNPDDPDGDQIEVIAWWAVDDLQGNPALRDEVLDTPWELLQNQALTAANTCHAPDSGQFCSGGSHTSTQNLSQKLKKSLFSELTEQGVPEDAPIRGVIDYPSNRIVVARDDSNRIIGALSYNKDRSGITLQQIRVQTDVKRAGTRTTLMTAAAKDALTIRGKDNQVMTAHGTIQDAVPFHQKLGAVFSRRPRLRSGGEKYYEWNSTGEYSAEATRTLAEGRTPVDKRIDLNDDSKFDPIYGRPKTDNPYAGPDYDIELRYYNEQQAKAKAKLSITEQARAAFKRKLAVEFANACHAPDTGRFCEGDSFPTVDQVKEEFGTKTPNKDGKVPDGKYYVTPKGDWVPVEFHGQPVEAKYSRPNPTGINPIFHFMEKTGLARVNLTKDELNVSIAKKLTTEQVDALFPNKKSRVFVDVDTPYASKNSVPLFNPSTTDLIELLDSIHASGLLETFSNPCHSPEDGKFCETHGPSSLPQRGGRFADVKPAARGGKKYGTPEHKGVIDVRPSSGSRGSDEEIAASKALADLKIATAPVPSKALVRKARRELEASKEGKLRDGGENRGNVYDRRNSRLNLFDEFGGFSRGYVVDPTTGLKMHWADPRPQIPDSNGKLVDNPDHIFNPNRYPTFERSKIFNHAQGGGYRQPNIIPESQTSNRTRGTKTVRKENKMTNYRLGLKFSSVSEQAREAYKTQLSARSEMNTEPDKTEQEVELVADTDVKLSVTEQARLAYKRSLVEKVELAGRGNAEALISYWRDGEGADRIAWGTKCDFIRCMLLVGKYLPDDAGGFCQNRHIEIYGESNAARDKRMGFKGGCKGTRRPK